MNIPSYGKVWKFQDSAVRQQFGDYVEIEEKIDGSQFSVMNEGGRLTFRSKNVEVHPEAPDMFAAAVAGARRLHNFRNFEPGYTLRFEFLMNPKHNTLAYGRVPAHNLMLYEIERPDDGGPLSRPALEDIAVLHEIEAVPLIYSGPLPSFAKLDELLDRESVLGKEKIEGLVIKARDRRHDRDGKILKAKYVSEEFKERHQRNGKPGDKSSKDAIAELIDSLATPARFRKAVEHLRDTGNLENDVRDIGKIIARVQQDLKEEEEQFIKDALYHWAQRRVLRGVSQGVPDWYKQQLTEAAA